MWGGHPCPPPFDFLVILSSWKEALVDIAVALSAQGGGAAKRAVGLDVLTPFWERRHVLEYPPPPYPDLLKSSSYRGNIPVVLGLQSLRAKILSRNELVERCGDFVCPMG